MKFYHTVAFLSLLVIKIECSDLSKQLEKEVAKYIEIGENPNLHGVIDKLFEEKKGDLSENNAYCVSCKVVANAAIKLRKTGASDRIFSKFLKDMCNAFSFSGPKTCTGLIDISLDSWLYILDYKNVTGERICSIRLQDKNCQDYTHTQWHIKIPERNSRSLPKSKTGKVKKILQLTDIHYDAFYKYGSNADCGEAICCQKDSGNALRPDGAAGYWADYHVCDLPWYTIENAMEHIKNQHPDIDRVYFTGDIISHHTWATTVEGNSKDVRKVLKILKKTFGDVPIYPILGNHESHPVDLFPPLDIRDDLSMQWLYDLVADEWSQWLPQETKATIRNGGHYTVLVKPGFRIIAINSNVCFYNNAWLVYDDHDPLKQLQWLTDTLYEAEKNGETVHILSHVPPGEFECAKQWSHEIKRIIERFHEIITGQFNGHTHFDELKVFYDPHDPDRVIHVAINGGSLTTFVGVNPNYKIYYVEEEQNQILDFESWIFDLPTANKDLIKPNWYKLYSFKDTFEMNDLKGDSFHNLLQRMSVNASLLEKFQTFRVKNSGKLAQTHYNKEFLNDVLCAITSTEYSYPKQCKNDFVPLIEKSDL